MESGTINIPLFPLTQGLFPEGLLRLNIFEVRYLDLIRKCEAAKSPFGVVILQEGSEVQTAGQTPKFHTHGTLAHLQTVIRVQPNLFKVSCLGGARFALKDYELGTYGVWYANVTCLPEDKVQEMPQRLQSLADKLGGLIAAVIKEGKADQLPFTAPYKLDEAGWVSNRLAEVLPLAPVEKHELLMQEDPVDRLEMIAKKISFDEN
jgi:uncharacterized protein